MSTTPSLLFTPERIARAKKRGRPYSGPALDRLILLPDWYTTPRREQLERIAARVPGEKRTRVLRPLDSKGDHGAINQLLLGAMLAELGWNVDPEPNIDGKTPDFRIEKDGAEFVVEVMRVERPDPFEEAIARIRDALEPYSTHRPISITGAHVNGSASLKGFVRHVRSLEDAPPGQTGGRFREDGVSVAFILHERVAQPRRILLSWSPGTRVGDFVDDIRDAIAEKTKRYKLPLIVAVDLVGVIRPFEDTQSALYGNQVFSIPVRRDGGELPPDVPEVSLIRIPDGPLTARGAAGKRARARLIGVLPFQVSLNPQLHYSVNAALLGTLQATRELVSGFSPMPHCVPTEIGEREATMTWFGGEGPPLEHPAWAQWSWAPAARSSNDLGEGDGSTPALGAPRRNGD
jgi:hypothetical protein